VTSQTEFIVYNAIQEATLSGTSYTPKDDGERYVARELAKEGLVMDVGDGCYCLTEDETEAITGITEEEV
jgi:hypothetical protein